MHLAERLPRERKYRAMATLQDCATIWIVGNVRMGSLQIASDRVRS